MGAEQSQVPNLKQFENSQGLGILKQEQWESLGCRDDQRYGEIKLYQNASGQQIALINKTCHNQVEYGEVSQKLGKGRELNALGGMVKVLEVYAQEEGNLCSSFYKISAVYEYYSKTLEDYLKRGMQFETRSVEVFLGSMVGILKVLYEQNIPHGDLRPENIFVTDNGFKLNNIQQMTGFNQYKRVLIDEEQKCYLSPELLACLARKELRPNYDQQKADVYTLGLVLLELALACDIQKLYDLDSYQLNQPYLDGLIHKFGERMGDPMKHTLNDMLAPNVAHRTTFAQLAAALPNKERPPSHQHQHQQVASSKAVQNSPAHQPLVNRSIFAKQTEKPKIKLLGSPLIERTEKQGIQVTPKPSQVDYGQQQMETAQFVQDSLKDQTNAVLRQTSKTKQDANPGKASFKRPRNDQNIFKGASTNAKKIAVFKKR